MSRVTAYRLFSVFLVFVLLLAAAGPAAQADIDQDSGAVGRLATGPEGAQFVAGEVIVGLRDYSEGEALEVARSLGATVKDRLPSLGAVLLTLPADKAVGQTVASLATNPKVAYAEPNGIVSIPKPVGALGKVGDKTSVALAVSPLAYNPNDNLRSWQWHLDKILHRLAPAPLAADPAIAVLDTGVDYNHPDLSGKVCKGPDYFFGDADPMDDNGHGTHVAGIAAAKSNNSIGVSGVSPNSPIMAVKVLGPAGWGSDWMVAQGILYAATGSGNTCQGKPVKVLNLSLGSVFSSTTLRDAIDAATAAGRLVVVAAGNDNTSRPSYPAYYSNAFAVAATEETDSRTYFSNYGSTSDPWVDIAAPGWRVLSTYMQGQYTRLSGTSMSGPVVAGAAARLWGKSPAMTVAAVRTQLVSKGDVTKGFYVTTRRVNLARALGTMPANGISGEVRDAATGQPIQGATVRAYQASVLKATATTDGAGMYDLVGTLGPGSTQVKVSKAGYVTQNRTITLSYKQGVNFRLSQSRPAGEWTMAVEWARMQPGSVPNPAPLAAAELDIFFQVPGWLFCIHYGYQVIGDPWRYIYVRDSTDDMTPMETVLARNPDSGPHELWVRRYTGWGGDLTTSGAVARIYRGSTVRANVAVTTTGSGNWWHVADLDLQNNVVTIVNAIGNTPPFCY